MTFSIGDTEFIDSLQHVPSSLEQLAKQILSNNPNDTYEYCHNMKKNILIKMS